MGGEIGGLMANPEGPARCQRWARARKAMVAGACVLGALVVGVAAAMVVLTRWLAGKFLTLEPERRRPLLERPEDYGPVCEGVGVVTEDRLALRGWYLPGKNGATVMVQHGSPGGRQDGLVEAAFLNKHGYNVLLGSFRAHDECDGQRLSFGYREMKDTAAWHNFLLSREEVNPARIGIFGESIGGAVGVRFAAENEAVAAVATASTPAVLVEAVELMIDSDVPAPRWSVPILTQLFLFWAERRTGCTAEELAVLPVVGRISPRPVLIIQGGNENRVPPAHGRKLYEAAGEPKEFWFVEEAGHVDFELYRPEEYERRVVGFFDKYLGVA